MTLETAELFNSKLNFNSHTREGVTWYCWRCLVWYWYFNSHTREGVTRIASLCSIAGSFQLTHPWGCDEERTASNGIITISTHTPVRVWLSSMGSSAFQTIISTHTPVRVWPDTKTSCRYIKYISTHTPVRVWPQFGFGFRCGNCISTHTPVRVWHTSLLVSATSNYFNSHTREGVTC